MQVRDAARERSEQECEQELQGIDRSAAAQGGLKKLFVAYGIFGFVRFLDCYYMALIMKRRLVGTIAGHSIYQVTGVKCVHMLVRCIFAIEWHTRHSTHVCV